MGACTAASFCLGCRWVTLRFLASTSRVPRTQDSPGAERFVPSRDLDRSCHLQARVSSGLVYVDSLTFQLSLISPVVQISVKTLLGLHSRVPGTQDRPGAERLVPSRDLDRSCHLSAPVLSGFGIWTV